MLCRANAKLDIKTGHVADVEVYCQDGEGSGCRGDAEGTHKPPSFLWVSSPALLLWRAAYRLLKTLRARDL